MEMSLEALLDPIWFASFERPTSRNGHRKTSHACSCPSNYQTYDSGEGSKNNHGSYSASKTASSESLQVPKHDGWNVSCEQRAASVCLCLRQSFWQPYTDRNAPMKLWRSIETQDCTPMIVESLSSRVSSRNRVWNSIHLSKCRISLNDSFFAFWWRYPILVWGRRHVHTRRSYSLGEGGSLLCLGTPPCEREQEKLSNQWRCGFGCWGISTVPFGAAHAAAISVLEKRSPIRNYGCHLALLLWWPGAVRSDWADVLFSKRLDAEDEWQLLLHGAFSQSPQRGVCWGQRLKVLLTFTRGAIMRCSTNTPGKYTWKKETGATRMIHR